jgi:hypothetical protein
MPASLGYAQKLSKETAAGRKTAKKYQAKAPPTKPFGKEAFGPSKATTIRWLGMARFLVNSRGTTFMIDPLVEGYDLPLQMKFPITPKEVAHVDAILAMHSDNDHYSVETFKDLSLHLSMAIRSD